MKNIENIVKLLKELILIKEKHTNNDIMSYVRHIINNKNEFYTCEGCIAIEFNVLYTYIVIKVSLNSDSYEININFEYDINKENVESYTFECINIWKINYNDYKTDPIYEFLYNFK